ncbi:DUF1492 domain-containing protein [Parabacteroides distasonis]|uniref:DUF1492 domain-containing protein n=1 Tax=Parabacteroides distasonis TaxID=823 RepID=A0A7K0GNF3_PARDI|nr:DUF1492 domain-containing protein [Parabacteroides distasonis]MRY60410.1 DUF1492 domain-containing protein [Parabacteroides distasonis]MRY69594.1 DUF1492 domain-containing protein [Parabacteroides distasonis]
MVRTLTARLKALSLLDSKIRSKRQEIISLKSGILTSVKYTDEPKGGGQSNSTEALNTRIIDKTQEIYEDISRIFDERDELVKAIDSLTDPLESQVLRLKYINGYSWGMVQQEMPLHSRRTLFEYRDRGIKNLEKALH